MKLIDIVVLLICIGFVFMIAYRSHKKAKLNKMNGNISCGGSCAGCSGCSNIKAFLKERKG